jgi:outer membrane receptor for ferrienterochelin and colicins
VKHDSNLSSSFNLSYRSTDGADVQTGTDFLTAFGQSNLSQAPGKPNLNKKSVSNFYNLQAANWSLSAFFMGEERGDGYGYGQALSGSDETVLLTEQFGVELKADDSIGSWAVDYRFAIQYTKREFDEVFLFPAGFLGVYTIDTVFSSVEAENRYETGVSFSRKLDKHRQNFGIEISRSESTDIFFEATFDESNLTPFFNIPAPLTKLTEQPLGLEDRNRTISSAYFSDQIAIDDNFDVVAGFRLDRYSDIGDSSLFSPRLAGTYEINLSQLFKLQYARAFHPPSLSQLHYQFGLRENGHVGNDDLNPEIVDTIEFAHIHRNQNSRIRSTLYVSKIDGLIRVDSKGQFKNLHDTSRGLEFSFEYHPEANIKWFGNISFLNSNDEDIDIRLEESTNQLVNIGVTWAPSGRYSTTLRLRQVGNRYRSDDDVRDSLDSYHVFHLHGQMRDFLSPGMILRYSVSNLFDEDIYDPAPSMTYADDYPLADRAYWLQISQSFV